MDVETINPLALPYLPLLERQNLPECPAIYFVLERERILYIGRSNNLRQRWMSHHRYNELEKMAGDIRLAWLECSDRSLLPEIERALIKHFQPPLNHSRVLEAPKKRISRAPLHPYSDKLAFERIMLLIATFVQYPGVGCAEDDRQREEHHNALQEVQTRLWEVAAACGVSFPEGYPAIPTIRKDLQTLRRYGILARRMYRWGYYVGTGPMSLKEFKAVFDGLTSAAQYQGYPQARRIYETLAKRLQGLDIELNGTLFYPVWLMLNRPIVYTDPAEMMAEGENRDNLFHQLDVVEQAILKGQAIEISRSSDPYGRRRVGPIRIWPLQLGFHDIAWYIIYEYCSNGHLEVGRIDRFKDYCKIITPSGRGLAAQKQSLANAHKLLENGWGLYLGEPEEQRAELQGRLKFESVRVRFFPPVIDFILEGDRRHRTQLLRKGPADSATGKPAYVDYTVKLPGRSLREFSLWVNRHMESACVLSPPALVEQHRQAAKAHLARYESN